MNGGSTHSRQQSQHKHQNAHAPYPVAEAPPEQHALVQSLYPGQDAGASGGEAGDLLLKVTVAPKPGYERKGMDVYTTVSVPYTTAVFGGEA